MKAEKAIISFGLAIIVTSLSLGGCGTSGSSLLELVPSDSCAVVVLDWQSVRSDPDFGRVFKSNDFEKLLQRLAVDSSSVKTLIVFSAMNSQVKAGLLLRGLFDKQSQFSALKARGWREETIDGHKVHVNGNDYAAVPQNNILFAGTREAALAVFQVLNSSGGNFVSSSSYRKLDAGLTTKNNPVRAFLVIPEGALDAADAALEATSFALSLFDLGGVGACLKQINIASGFGLSLAHGSNQIYPVEMCVLMRDEKAAAFLNGSLNAMKGLSTMASANNRDQESLRALQSMTITRKQEVLAIKMNMPHAVLFPPNAP